MSTINSVFPPDSEFSWRNYFGGITRAILGNREGKFSFTRDVFQNFNTKILPIDTGWERLLSVALNVPHLNVVLSEGAKMFTQMEIIHVNKDGEIIEDSPVMKLLRQPNYFQSMEDWLYEFYIYNGIYNNNFIYKNKGSMLAPLPSFLWCLPPGGITVNLAKTMPYRQTEMKGLVTNYMLQGDPTPFTPEEILFIKEGVSLNGITAGTNVQSLQMPLSNIVAALKSLNIITTERGLIGFIASEGGTKDSDGALPLGKDEAKRVEDEYQRQRSLDSQRGHVGFTSANIKWVPMTFDVAQLKLMEGLEDAFGQICGRLGIDRDIFPSTKGATNENKKQGEVRTYQSTMQPLANKLMRNLMRDFGLEEKGERLEASYDWLPVMKADAAKEAETLNKKITSVVAMVQANIINPAQAQGLIEAITDLDIDEALASSSGIMGKLTEVSPLIANNMIGNMTINEVREILGLPGIAIGEGLAKTGASSGTGAPKPSGEA